MYRYLYVALGGALGSIARYWVGTTVAGRMGARFPYGTFVINITACFVIGVSLEFLNRHAELNPSWRFLVPVGFIGAYSTFSTFEWETFTTVQNGASWLALLYVVASIVFGYAAVAGGVALVKRLP